MIATFVTTKHDHHGDDIIFSGPSGYHWLIGAIKPDFVNMGSHIRLLERTSPPIIYKAKAND